MSLVFTDITPQINAMPEGTTLLRFSDGPLKPSYAKELLSLFLLSEWPLSGNINLPDIPTATGASRWLRLYAALMPHGKTHVAEIFFLLQKKEEEKQGVYLGSSKVLSILFPDNQYHPSYDDEIIETLCKHMTIEIENDGE